MKGDHSTSLDRIYYFDNIRYLMVLLVVVLHALCAYSNYIPWWVVNDQNAKIFDDMLLFLGIFLMPTLFYIAGYFTLPSLNSKSTWEFIKHKIKRLGIPCLIGVLLFNPLHNYIKIYAYVNHGGNLWVIFKKKIMSALTFHTGYISEQNQFHHHYFWFISLLLLFFIIFALIVKGKNRSGEKSLSGKNQERPSTLSIVLTILITAFIISVLTFLVHEILPIDPYRPSWISIANIIQFQPTKLALYIFSFSLGIYSFHKHWYANNKAPGHFLVWMILSIILGFSLKMFMVSYARNPSLLISFVNVSLAIFLFFSILLTLVSFSLKYWDSSSKPNTLLAANSYHIYLIHMIFVIFSQLVLFKWLDVSNYIKFIIVSVFSIGLSFLISQYAIRKFPKTSIASFIGIFILLLVVLR